VLEFEASGADTALFRAQKHCRGIEAELFENGRSLGRIVCNADSGFWLLSKNGADTPPSVRS
jgi:hypothetical protein